MQPRPSGIDRQPRPIRIDVVLGDRRTGLVHLDAPVDSLATTVDLGPVTVELGGSEPSAARGAGPGAGGRGARAAPAFELAWSVANRSDAPVRIRSVALVFAVDGATERLAMVTNGYQSWSPAGLRVLGRDRDPSTAGGPGGSGILRAAHHADAVPVAGDQLRSEWVALIVDRSQTAAPWLVGFDGGDRHDGTIRLTPPAAAAASADRRDGPAGRNRTAECAVEAFLGGARLDPGVSRTLHRVMVDARDELDGPSKLAAWASEVGRRGRARVAHPYVVGWCSWYHYFDAVTEDDFRSQLARSADWPFEMFQLDDGYQRAVGDWLTCSDAFPSSLDSLAAAVSASGRVPGLWIAPFLVAPGSQLFARHPDWMTGEPGPRPAGGEDRRPRRAWWNPAWTGADDGSVYGLDTSSPEVLDHLQTVASELVDAGFRYLKLDFTFAPSVEGHHADETLTPAERVRAGFDAIRRGAGEDTFLLGCGVPLANVVGVVDGCRIGQDVAPVWDLDPDLELVPGYLRTQPATRYATTNTMVRSFMHRRLWQNDPDCVMVRARSTRLTPEQIRTWAMTVAVSGGMAVVSDDLDLVDPPGRSLFDEVVAVGRASDHEARQGRAAVCPDLVDRAEPTRLRAGPFELVVDPQRGRSERRR